MKLILLSTDLMISSLVTGVARQLGLTVVPARDEPTALASADDDEARVLVADLRCPSLDIESLVTKLHDSGSPAVRIVAFGPHVHEAKLEAARQVGCDAVATRGQFDRDAAEIISRLLKA